MQLRIKFTITPTFTLRKLEPLRAKPRLQPALGTRTSTPMGSIENNVVMCESWTVEEEKARRGGSRDRISCRNLDGRTFVDSFSVFLLFLSLFSVFVDTSMLET